MSESYFRQPRKDLADWIRPAPGSSVLEVGCGEGAMAALLREQGCGRLVGIELNAGAAMVARLRLDEVHVGRVEDVLPTLSAERFDLIVCADVLEHLPDPWAVVAQLRAIATPGGMLAVSLPNIRYLPALARIALGRGFEYADQGIFDRTHLRFFTRRNMRQLLIDGGWTPTRWSNPEAGRYRHIRKGLSRLSGGISNEWGSPQWYVVARNELP